MSICTFLSTPAQALSRLDSIRQPQRQVGRGPVVIKGPRGRCRHMLATCLCLLLYGLFLLGLALPVGRFAFHSAIPSEESEGNRCVCCLQLPSSLCSLTPISIQTANRTTLYGNHRAQNLPGAGAGTCLSAGLLSFLLSAFLALLCLAGLGAGLPSTSV